MKISQEFEVGRTVETVWTFFQDVPSVAQCMPGAELTEDKGDNTYAGKLSVKLGPMSASFEGEATVTVEETTHSAHIDGKGADRRGGSRGQVQVDYALASSPAGTLVSVDADITLSGAIAQFGRTGLVNEMSKRLIEEFVACLEQKLAAETVEEAAAVTAKEVKGFTLFFASFTSWIGGLIKRLFGGGKKE